MIPVRRVVMCRLGSYTYERIALRSRLGDHEPQHITRYAELERKPDARATVVICHGFLCDKDDIKFLRWLFPDCNTIVFDFRGHGEACEHQCCTFGYDEAYDVIAAGDFIRNDAHLSHLPRIVYGFSMGAAASIRAQALRPDLFHCAIWDAPFDSTDLTLERCLQKLRMSLAGYHISVPGRALLKKHIDKPWVQRMLKQILKTIAHIDASPVVTQIKYMAPMELVTHVTIPTLFVGCWHDERTPYEAIRAVYDNAKGYKRLWMTPGRRHFDSFFFAPETYAEKVRAFIQQYIDGDTHHIKRKTTYYMKKGV